MIGSRAATIGPTAALRVTADKQISAARRPTILLAGKLTAFEAPGGGEAQMLALVAALPKLGVDARLWRPWEERLGRADCLHLFGSEPEHQRVIDAAHRRGVPVVLSTIAWFDLAAAWREPWPLPRRLAACARFAARAALPRLPSWRRRLYHSADLLLPNSKAEACQLVRYFCVPEHRIHITPNGAERRFAADDPEPFRKLVGCTQFVLYAGRIEPRKNQLGFLRAMRGLDVPIVILGDAVPGHETYLAACRREAGAAVRFIGRIDRDNPLLASAYAACGCLVLASWYETPGLVALEAGMSGVPLVLPHHGCAREYFGNSAAYVKPNDFGEIRRQVLSALGRNRSPAQARLIEQNYSWEAAAAVTRQAYEKVL